jgi:hypothetical protein
VRLVEQWSDKFFKAEYLVPIKNGIAGLGYGIFLLFLVRQVSTTTRIFEQICLAAMLTFITMLSFYAVTTTRHTNELSRLKNPVMVSLITSLLVFNFGTIGLMNIDRSKSFYVLVWCSEPKPLESIFELNNAQFDGVEETGVMMRLEEQKTRGLVDFSGDSYMLTNKGRITLKIAKLMATIFRLSGFTKVYEGTKNAPL